MIKSLMTAAALALMSASAHANTYQFVFESNPGQSYQTVMGEITTSDMLNSKGGYDVLSISGTVSAPGSDGTAQPIAISGLSDFDGADNIFYASDPRVDFDGVAFTTVTGGLYDLYSFGGGAPQYEIDYAPNEGSDITGSIGSLIVTSGAPEPATWTLMLAAIGIAGYALRCRRVSAIAAA